MPKLEVLTNILLLETADPTTKIIGGDGEGGPLKLQGIFQKGDEPNSNRRVYPAKFLAKEVERLSPIVNSRALVGELDHPVYSNEQEAAQIHYKNVSHVLTRLWMEGNYVMGELEILDTPSGYILKEFVKKKIRIGVSSRALGSEHTAPNGFNYIDDNFKVITWDTVAGPSVTESNLQTVKTLNEWQTLTNEQKLLPTNNVVLTENSLKPEVQNAEELEQLRLEIKKKIHGFEF